MNLYKYAAIMGVFNDEPEDKITITIDDIKKFKKSLGSINRIKNLNITSLDRIACLSFSPYEESVFFQFIFNGKAIDTEDGEEKEITIEFICNFIINDFNESTVKCNIVFNYTGEILQRTIPQERWM